MSRPPSYGDHAEAAAAALNRLIVEDRIPVEPAEVEQLLHCREAVIDALRERLYGFGLGARHQATLPLTANSLQLDGIDTRLATLVDRTTFEVPALPPDDRKAPSEVLGHRGTDETVELWRRSAVELLAGSHALATAVDRPWLTHAGAGWYLMRDIAVALEAFLVLDDRLAEVGLLTQHVHPDASLGVEEWRLIASQCARMANWFATSDCPDQATPRSSGERVVVGPVQLVSTPTDLARAQWRLAAFLRPVHASDASYLGEPEISADTARHIVASQLFLTRYFSTLANQPAAHQTATREAAGDQALTGEFNVRWELLRDIQPRLRYLVDVDTHEVNRHRMWQQGEITTAARRLRRDGTDTTLAPAELLELANATHAVTNNLARSLRRELLRINSNLRIDDPTRRIGATRVVRRSPLETSLTELVNQPAPSAPVARFRSALQRAALRRTLDETPTRSTAPHPFKAARTRHAVSEPGR